MGWRTGLYTPLYRTTREHPPLIHPRKVDISVKGGSGAKDDATPGAGLAHRDARLPVSPVFDQESNVRLTITVEIAAKVAGRDSSRETVLRIEPLWPESLSFRGGKLTSIATRSDSRPHSKHHDGYDASHSGRPANGLRLSGDGGEADGVRCSRGLAATGRGGKIARMAEVKEVLDEALKLGPDDRASVAVELLESLEAAPEEKAALEAAWAAEIERRARRVLRGESSGTAWDEVRRRTEANLARR
jgi:putative addiction module component (TIGR02574 family)